jgi:hypothetical protein
MRKIISLLILVFLSFHCQAQVTWAFSAKKVADKTFEIHLVASVDEPWHIYAQDSPKGGPLPTKIIFSKNPLLLLSGKVREDGDMEMYHDQIFNVDVYSYTNKVDFVQVVKLKANAKTTIYGTVGFMACTKEQCLTPQTINFTIPLQ